MKIKLPRYKSQKLELKQTLNLWMVWKKKSYPQEKHWKVGCFLFLSLEKSAEREREVIRAHLGSLDPFWSGLCFVGLFSFPNYKWICYCKELALPFFSNTSGHLSHSLVTLLNLALAKKNLIFILFSKIFK